MNLNFVHHFHSLCNNERTKFTTYYMSLSIQSCILHNNSNEWYRPSNIETSLKGKNTSIYFFTPTIPPSPFISSIHPYFHHHILDITSSWNFKPQTTSHKENNTIMLTTFLKLFHDIRLPLMSFLTNAKTKPKVTIH